MAQSEADGINWDLVSYVTNSKYRQSTLEALAKSPRRPTDIDAHSVAHISRALQELRDKDVVELLVSEGTKKGRYYGLTDEGEEIVEYIEDL